MGGREKRLSWKLGGELPCLEYEMWQKPQEKSKLSKMEDENQLQKGLSGCAWICSSARTAQSSLAFVCTHCEI